MLPLEEDRSWCWVAKRWWQVCPRTKADMVMVVDTEMFVDISPGRTLGDVTDRLSVTPMSRCPWRQGCVRWQRQTLYTWPRSKVRLCQDEPRGERTKCDGWFTPYVLIMPCRAICSAAYRLQSKSVSKLDGS